MLGTLWKKWKNARDEKLRAEYQERDTRLGTPTTATLNERAQRAAEKGYWKTAIAAIDQGADVNLDVTESYRFEHSTMARRFSLAHIAAGQDNAEALAQLLARGAKQDAIGVSSVSGSSWAREDKYFPLEYAALQGAKNSLTVLLDKGGNPQEALNGALRIAAGEKTYLGMTEALLKAGAKDYEGAQRAAEVRGNEPAILMIKDVAKKAFAAANDRQETPPAPQMVAGPRPATAKKL